MINIKSVSFGVVLATFLLFGTSVYAQKKTTKDQANAPVNLKEPQNLGPALSVKQQDSLAKTSKYRDLAWTAQADKKWQASFAQEQGLAYLAESRLDDTTQTAQRQNLQERLKVLDKKTIFDVAYHPSLESVIHMFLTEKRDLMERMLFRSQYYFPLFEQELDAQGMPLEIKYLAMVESALNPTAKSRVGATGLWQFMYDTGKMYGLEVTNYVDERQDPVKSTQAAVRYLKKLHQIFGDWNLALAAYNSGPGNVNKAIRRAGGNKNFWAIRPYLPKETSGYVPAFLASMYIFEHAGPLGLKAAPLAVPRHATDTVQVKQWMEFGALAKELSVDSALIAQLNPQYKKQVIPYVEGERYGLRLPVEAVGRFVANEKQIYAQLKPAELARRAQVEAMVQAAPAVTRYKVRSGDFLGKIANKHQVTVKQIMQWNKLKSTNIAVGQSLIIHGKNSGSSVAQNSTASTKAKAGSNQSDTEWYEVRPGDTLWSIAQRFKDVSLDQIKQWNPQLGNNIQPGTKVKVCACTP
ncbi:MAG: transglycosylase SLT domain-containing protein [Flavobacteriaceae bacterium]|nr:transglycosylase SLT domain-containing protein [Flavobacteriaceae bacterium]MDP4674178.1 transglycosylase SLT domain-containing protein [Flavobacteriaceae bacterium]MDP4754076.1 transglycosylase SLT domain-containing protein [Flavobacteriaceae bacterium]MDP4793942.1 transglycosylase SLT domain-containing protein [Flavobacteriaceae bacterium]MDP4886344.1 transglycosylase SLT domain-containing protein [Flavobacteriaceae bacterium]